MDYRTPSLDKVVEAVRRLEIVRIIAFPRLMSFAVDARIVRSRSSSERQEDCGKIALELMTLNKYKEVMIPSSNKANEQSDQKDNHEHTRRDSRHRPYHPKQRQGCGILRTGIRHDVEYLERLSPISKTGQTFWLLTRAV